MNETGDMVKAQNQYLVFHTVPETLLYMNADDKVAEDIGFYSRQAHFGEPGDWPVPTSSPIGSGETCESTAISHSLSNRPMSASWGAGHLGWLRHDFARDPASTYASSPIS